MVTSHTEIWIDVFVWKRKMIEFYTQSEGENQKHTIIVYLS